MRSLPFAALIALNACQSEPLDPDACPEVGTVHEPFSRKCWSQPLEPVSDPASPDYGRVECVIVRASPAGSGECRCDTPGFAPATPEQVELGRSNFSASGSCEAPCCEELCFCEFLQHSGDALAACQSRESVGTYRGDPTGWCYVDPALGFGTEMDVATCPSTQKREIRLFPDEPRYNIDLVVACVGEP